MNDIPVFRYFEDGAIMTPIVLNNFISTSGQQTLTYRLYPQTKVAGFPEGLKELTAFTQMKITLYNRDNADSIASFDRATEILKHTSLTSEDGNSFIAAGKPYYEYTLNFDAEVPYKLTKLDNAQDLRNLDQDALQAKIKNAYQYYLRLIEKKEKNTYFSIEYNSLFRQVQTEYFDQELLQESGEEDQFLFEEPTLEIQPLEDYKLVLYADGRLATLVQNSTDPRLFNRSAIWSKYKTKNGGTRVRFRWLYLYLPEGKQTFESW